MKAIVKLIVLSISLNLLKAQIPDGLVNYANSCSTALNLSHCSGQNKGDYCRLGYYMSDHICLERKKLVSHCIKYENNDIDDGNCLLCEDEHFLLWDARPTQSTFTCNVGLSALDNCKWGYRYRIYMSIWIMCYACEPGFYPILHTDVSALSH